ncbi:unnamed protein product [Dibothriocephalus latus]|uniref:Uncharacterized protein n=1 Tax=Dibothriocephalus latus TaxID=60516 RepID=A0A3P7QPN3_DIBLA|nr:unnamed protein product [Dibothriocephalus latus]
MFSTRSSQNSRDPAPKDGARASKRRMLQRRNANYLDLNDDSTISSSLVQKFKTSSNAESYRQSGSSGRNSSRLEGLRKSLQSLAKDIHKDSAELTSLIKESLSRTDSNPRQEEDTPPPPGDELKELKETIRQLTKGVSSENKQINNEEEEEESEDDDDDEDSEEEDDENEDSDEEDSDDEEEDADDDIEEEEEEPPSSQKRPKKTPAKKTTSRRKFKVEEEKRGRGSRRHLADGEVEKPTGERR